MPLQRCFHNSAKLGQIRDIQEFMEPGENAWHDWKKYMTKPHKLASMYVIFLHARANMSAKLHQISDMKASMAS